MTLEIRTNGSIFIAGTKGSTAANSPFESRAVLKEAGFWWHGGPCKPGCKACDARVPKMWWTADAAKAARLRAFCDEKALAAVAPILALKAQSAATSSNLVVPCPDGLAYDPFQVAGIEFVLNAWRSFKGALIADEMGLGKTVQALGLMNSLDDEHPLYCAVVCPKSLVLNWKREAQKWLTRRFWPWTVLTYEEWLDHQDECTNAGHNTLVIWTYSQVNKFPRKRFDLLVFDEAHYIKNPEAQRTQECIASYSKGKPVEGSGRIAAQADRLLFLTGTPILNRPLELQTLLCAIDPSFSGFWFLKRFCDAHKDSQGHWDFSGASHLEELQDQLRTKFMVRRLKKDVYKDLPAKRRSLIPLDLTSEAKAILKNAGPEPKFEDAIADMESKKPWGHPAQVRQQLAMAKVDKVVEFVRDLLENTQKVIVFGFTVDSMKQIRNQLGIFGASLIIGDTKMEDRQAAVEQFQSDPNCRVIVGGYGPMGVGLTLTASSTVVMSEPAWTPAEVSQAEDRAHRRGQTEMVNCYHLVWNGSLEAKMMQMVINKQQIADRVLDRNTEIIVPESQRDEVKRQEVASRAVVASMSTPEEKALVLRALRFLAARCDGATAVDGQGFNKMDSDFGKSLAKSPALSDKQAHFGKKLIKKYRSQLEAGGISLAALEGV